MNGLPFVTVAIRSYRRLASMLELVRRCQAQEYPHFEIVVIEQSEGLREPYREALAELEQDPRVRLLEYPRLGYIRARNEAIRQARGEILLFMDDDDLPVGLHWISAHAANYTNPLCVAVVGREVPHEAADPTPHNKLWNYLSCLRYSPFLKLPIALNRHTRRIEGVDSIKGGGTSIRRAVLERVGPWEEQFDDLSHEEQYFDFKFQRLRRPGEHYVYDPAAAIVRRLDIPGGMDRRTTPAEHVLFEELYYSHKIVRRFFPVRFYTYYLAYVGAHVMRALLWLQKEQPQTPLVEHVRALAVAFVPTLVKAWR